jgi:glutamate racemase
VIKKVMGDKVTLIDSAKQVAIEVKDILGSEDLLNRNHRGKYKLYVSDNAEWFSSLARRFLGQNIIQVKKVNST